LTGVISGVCGTGSNFVVGETTGFEGSGRLLGGKTAGVVGVGLIGVRGRTGAAGPGKNDAGPGTGEAIVGAGLPPTGVNGALS